MTKAQPEDVPHRRIMDALHLVILNNESAPERAGEALEFEAVGAAVWVRCSVDRLEAVFRQEAVNVITAKAERGANSGKGGQDDQ